MQKINFLIQFVIRFFLTFLLSFVWARFFTKKLSTAILISFLVSILFELVLFIFKRRSDKLKTLKFQEQSDCENMFLSLATAPNYLNFFEKLAKAKHKTEKHSKFLTILHDDGNVILYPLLSLSPITPNEINQVLLSTRKHPNKKIVICCGEISKEASTFVKKLDKNITLLDKVDTYKKLYKPYNIFPEITFKQKEDKKTTFKEILTLSLNKSKTKHYLFSAVVILFSSIFVPLNIYYSLVASLLLIFAIISFINPFGKQKTTQFEL